MKKNILTSLLLAGTLAIGALTGCGSTAPETTSEAPAAETPAAEAPAAETPAAEAPATEGDASDKKITVGATPVPHAEILYNIVKEVLAEDGWELETVVFSDYVLPNTSLEEGELDANYFQTLGYMNQQNLEYK